LDIKGGMRNVSQFHRQTLIEIKVSGGGGGGPSVWYLQSTAGHISRYCVQYANRPSPSWLRYCVIKRPPPVSAI